MSGSSRLLAVGASLVAGLALLVAPGVAEAKASATLGLRAGSAVSAPSSKVTFTGRLLPIQSASVVLQRRAGKRWVSAGKGRTTGKGFFTITSVMPAAQGTYTFRAVARHSRRTAAVTSAVRTVTLRFQTANLSDLSTVNCCSVSRGTVAVDGKAYAHSVYFDAYSTANRDIADYDLARKWRSFKATVGIGDSSQSGAAGRVEIFADGRLAKSYDIALGVASPVDIDVAGVQRLRIEASVWSGANSGSNQVVVGDGLLSTAASAAAAVAGPVVTYLEDRDRMSVSECSGTGGHLSTLAGGTYQGSVLFGFYGQADSDCVEYDLGRGFQTMTATFGPTDDSEQSGSVAITVLGDGVVLAQATTTLGHPVPLTFSVANVLRLHIDTTWVDATDARGGAVLASARLVA